MGAMKRYWMEVVEAMQVDYDVIASSERAFDATYAEAVRILNDPGLSDDRKAELGKLGYTVDATWPADVPVHRLYFCQDCEEYILFGPNAPKYYDEFGPP